MSYGNAAQWVKFFNAAGIPSSVAATYAHIFVENRIQNDMLADLNKEYLREMGITVLGDIIAILRQAKTVTEQTAREKILSSEIKVPIAAVPANSSLPSSNKISLKPRVTSTAVNPSTSTNTEPLLQNNNVTVSNSNIGRRVLLEPEVGYKVKLPSGSTPRSKEILARKSKLYSEMETNKLNVFERLSLNENSNGSCDSSNHINIKIDKPTSGSSSIFSRLGGKDEEKLLTTAVAGILKSSPNKKAVVGVTKKPFKPTLKMQKVYLVKKIPAKAATMLDDNDDFDNEQEKMETGEKTVSFSSEDEVLEIAPRRIVLKQNLNIKSRLNNLHGIKKINMKPANGKKRNAVKKVDSYLLRMKSDDLLYKKPLPVQSRLDLSCRKKIGNNQKNNSVTKLTNRISKVSLSTIIKRTEPQSRSVFDRLGFEE